MNKTHDLTGQKFGKLAVIRRAENAKDRNSKWLCKCDCGSEAIVYGFHLKSRKTTSCGCDGKYGRPSSIYVAINGVTKSLSEWSKESGIRYHTLKNRLEIGVAGEKLLTPVVRFKR